MARTASATDPLRNMAPMTEKLGLGTVTAAWPTGVSSLARAIDACQRCDTAEVCGDWLARVPATVAQPPPFCPNADEFSRVKQAKDR
jgi:hypothetical protein